MRADPDLTSALAARLLADEASAVRVGVAPLPGARIIWLAPAGIDAAQAVAAAATINSTGESSAWVDRYGAEGIGGNGGSGRAALIGSWHVKGVGPTPLIGLTTNSQHVSGGAYLEEAVRETIFAELFAAEIPWGAVRTEAIVDTGEDQLWPYNPDLGFQVPRERRVLLLREPVLRPAHLQRAPFFTGDEALTGASDVRRVAHVLNGLERALGPAGLCAAVRRLWLRWSEQCAYLYAWRLSQGSLSPSNIALDGRLLDFGAATSLPDWCATVTVPGEPENGHEVARIASFLRTFYAEHGDGVLTGGAAWADYADSLTAECQARYALTLGIEALRVAGLRREPILRWCARTGHPERLEAALLRATRRYLRVFHDEIEPDAASILWDLPRLWDEDPPVHLRPLATIADEVARDARGEPIRERMAVRCIARPLLSRESMRERLHRELPPVLPGEPVDAVRVRRIIEKTILAARRDCRFEPAVDLCFGVATSGRERFALFRRPDGTAYALAEAEGRETDVAGTPLCFDEHGSIEGAELTGIHIFAVAAHSARSVEALALA